VTVSGLSSVALVTAGTSYSLALKGDGTVWAWGWNNVGQLGDGTTTNRSTPVQVSGLSGIVFIGAGSSHSFAIKNDGTVWAWGANSNGQLGDGTTTNRATPVQVAGLTGVAALDGGQTHTVALKTDGTVWTWGANNLGQLGDGTTTQRTTPVQVTGLAGVSAVAAGDTYFSIALKSNGTIYSWGFNNYGQLGDGTTTNRLTPVPVVMSVGPSAPTALNYADKSATTVTLIWNAASDNVSVVGYNVYRGITLLGTTGDRAFTDSGLTANTAYTYTVRAFDGLGNLSPPSTALVVTTTQDFSADSDHDGIPDSIEAALGTNNGSAATAGPAVQTQQNIHRPIP
jgi:hypothetical protein